MEEREFDAIVVGGGPGGYPCAIRLAQLGLTVASVEEEEYGGVCLNWGCIPSKALISSSHLLGKAEHANAMGLSFGAPALDADKLQDWKNGIVKKLTGGVRTLLKQNGATLVEGRGRLTSARTVEVTRRDGSRELLRAKRGVVIATGSATIQIPGFEFDGERVIGAREAVNLRRLPKRLVVIGGGVIGLELGTVYQSFGAKLTVVELTDGLLPGIEPECTRVVERKLVKRGATLHLGTRALGCERRADGTVAVRIAKGGAEELIECDVVLVAVGMRPRSADLGLEALGVAIDRRGFIPTDDTCQTNVPGVYAVGDVSGAPMLAHKATKEGEVCAEVLAGQRAGKDWVTIPSIVFTDPEIAAVGLTEAAARAAGHEVKVGKFPFAALGRAMSLGETDGFTKVVADAATGRVLGIHLVGPSASDLVSEAALALEMGATAEDLALTVHPHPTLGEALMEASAAALGHAIHIVNR
ncbi:MAG: dihydrolipoyl dehydrogenase [Sorangiineae bacterium]|nr:dihydrolipoyl dehydrogenase [Polyangiaceae bacterium]MEB2324284.1 dihydrolipoyl dehydrogenase [Sorangiineae bacterium]